MKIFIQLSKTGDIISILPILHKEAVATGQKAKLLVGRDFAGVLTGCSYVEPIIWPKANEDLSGAIRHAKQFFSEVVVLQTHGNMPIQQTTPSFQFEQWKRGNCLDQFEKLPTVFDQRDKSREEQLIYWHTRDLPAPYILFGDHSQSSPFLHKEELATLIKQAFPNHCILRLSEVKAKQPYDLLSIYDNAVMLVTVETMHVHLSKASEVPTFVLAANGWRGSAFHSEFAYYMRYNEWDRRKAGLVEAMRMTGLDSTGKRAQVFKTLIPHGYNFSEIENPKSPGEFVSTYRAHTQGNWKTQLFCNDDPLQLPSKLSDNSIEDARLFVFNGRLHASYTVAQAIDGRWRCYIAYGEIDGDKLGHIQIKHPGNDMLGMNKNWTPFVHDGKLHFIYGIRGTNQIVLQVDADRVSAEYKAPAPVWEHGEIRGGAILPHAEGFIRFFHSRQDYQDKTVRYFVGAAIMEAKPPFKTIRVSTKPILEGDEHYTPFVRHWKANVVFPLGARVCPDGYVLSYGRNDCECCRVKLNHFDLNL